MRIPLFFEFYKNKQEQKITEGFRKENPLLFVWLRF